MVSIITKTINNRDYLYLVRSKREGKRVVQETIRYIGKKRPIERHEFGCMQFSYEKKDWLLQGFEDTLSYTVHHKMRAASKTYKGKLRKMDRVSREKEKLRFLSSFVSNSNAIEGSTLTVKETHDFLFNDVIPKKGTKKEIFMANNLLKAWEYVEKRSGSLPSSDDLRRLHKLVNRDIEDGSTLGSFKKIQNYLGDQYTTSFLFVEERLSMLLGWIRKAFRHVDDFEVAFQSHAQFELIHPFIDGNGRVGRLLLNWLLLYKGLAPLAVEVRDRSDYISAIEHFRQGKIVAISSFLSEQYLSQYSFM